MTEVNTLNYGNVLTKILSFLFYVLSEVYPFVSKTWGEMSVHYQGNGHYITVRVGGGGRRRGRDLIYLIPKGSVIF